MFLLDGSGSISEVGFRSAKQALVRELRAVTETFANVDVGVILFRFLLPLFYWLIYFLSFVLFGNFIQIYIVAGGWVTLILSISLLVLSFESFFKLFSLSISLVCLFVCLFVSLLVFLVCWFVCLAILSKHFLT